jgi:hypothetical protein
MVKQNFLSTFSSFHNLRYNHKRSWQVLFYGASGKNKPAYKRRRLYRNPQKREKMNDTPHFYSGDLNLNSHAGSSIPGLSERN